ncbi:SpoIID/LytB domain-containing protein [uncultured Flavonifractor sp.]|uniref:SpoIID/LytB domain-containing protein n=1 Tax=uncultured Flavonifractor sp. TaxID=1193534 RepID=UPI002636FA66|nr:SpoIID/LytB domain-containing protein [uncultured Flavonifractor sp.]
MQFAAAALVCVLLAAVPGAGTQAAAVDANPTVYVGLFYGSSALPGANLLNSVGSGYQLGYYDSSRVFQKLAQTEETAISVVKTQNVYYGTSGGWAGYYDTITSEIVVGCYHILLPDTYADYEQAAAAAAQWSGGFVAWIDGVYQVRVGAYPDKASAQAAQTALGLAEGTELVGTSSAGVSVVKTGTSQILFQFDNTGGLCLGIQPGLDTGGKAATIFRNNTYYGGFRYQRVGGGNLTVSNVVSMDDYIHGVILSEMNASWPLEALKAQAVAARSYAYGMIQASKHQSQGFDICNTVDCQAYKGIASATANSQAAIDGTSGVYLWYNGSVATQALYSSHDGGATESAVNVWGTEYPYLTGKADPYEALVADRITDYNWTVTYTAQELTDLLNSKGYVNSGIVDFKVTKTSPTGNAIEITFTDSSGKSWSKIRDDCRTFLGLRSIHYTVSGGGGTSTGYAVNGSGVLSTLTGAYAIDGSGGTAALTGGSVYAIGGDGTVGQLQPSAVSTGSSAAVFTITGSGWGHNVGMSQWGAYAMAQQGYTYQEILSFYYTGIEVRQP